MIFQTLDDKNECVGVYAEGKLSFDELPDGLTACWAPVPYLEDHNIEYASLYCEGKTPDQICPDNLRDDWEECNEKMKAFYRSLMLGQVSLDENCFFDLIPVRFLVKYCELRAKITKHVIETYEKPKNYDYLIKMTKLLTKIGHNKLNIDLSGLNSSMHREKTRNFREKAQSLPNKCL